MKKKRITLSVLCLLSIVGIFYFANTFAEKENSLFLENVEALSNDEGGYSCQATANCDIGGQSQGSVSCTGTESCESGTYYVICDGHVSKCTLQPLPQRNI